MIFEFYDTYFHGITINQHGLVKLEEIEDLYQSKFRDMKDKPWIELKVIIHILLPVIHFVHNNFYNLKFLLEICKNGNNKTNG